MLQPTAVRDIFTNIAEFFGTSRGAVVERLLNVLGIWIGGWLAYQLVRRIARRIIAAVDDGDDATMTAAERRGHTVAAIVRSAGRLLILLIVGLLTAGQFIAIGPLLAAGGIVGLTFSFGAQSLVKDLIAGFFILFENQFGIGDVIEAAGKSGTVERMTLRVTMLRDLRGVLHVVPNGQITTLSNLTRSWSRAVVEVGVAYGTDLDTALAVFRDEVARFQSDPVWSSRMEGTSEVLGVEELGEHGVVIRTLLRTSAGAQWEVAREFRRRLKNRLDAEGIEIPFPQRTVHVRHHGAQAGAGSPSFPAEGS
ncbi:MAG TPA: mechanosensitive ion channel family protein [Gemmatimonadales bacterium]|nr:mechanosensitive ion channel family protein [Gemmatimonadales bacterium]